MQSLHTLANNSGPSRSQPSYPKAQQLSIPFAATSERPHETRRCFLVLSFWNLPCAGFLPPIIDILENISIASDPVSYVSREKLFSHQLCCLNSTCRQILLPGWGEQETVLAPGSSQAVAHSLLNPHHLQNTYFMLIYIYIIIFNYFHDYYPLEIKFTTIKPWNKL